MNQKNSWSSLDICEAKMRIVFENHNIMPEFVEVVRCFQDRTANGEQAFGGAVWKRCTTSMKGSIPSFRKNN